jgi:hypothetical protein
MVNAAAEIMGLPLVDEFCRPLTTHVRLLSPDTL